MFSYEEDFSTMRRFAVGTFAVAVLAVAGAVAGEGLKSGPQVGTNIPGPFDVLNLNGPAAGEKNCQV
jgi:hypothetical protein